MDRDKALRRTSALTGVLVAAGLAGTLGVGLAARAADSTETTTPATDSSTAPGSATESATDSGSGSTGTDAPSLSGGSDGSGQATSGGS
jgi:hypothetical protein